MIYNLAFDPSRMAYTHAYENSLHFSRQFQTYAQELATRLIDKYQLQGKRIIEIGCGKGEFLSMLCRGGQNHGVGFDPSCDAGSSAGETLEDITLISDVYSEAYAELTADLICCRQVLEHIQAPRDFLLQLRQVIGKRPDGIAFFEVPNVLYTLRDFAIWDIIYEHCSYFSPSALTRIFQKTGFAVLQVYPAFGGQFLCLEASPKAIRADPSTEPTAELEELSGFVSSFAAHYQRKVKTWNEALNRWLEQGSRMVVWGAGSKGVTFLNTVDAGKQLRYVVDINPRKQGMHVAGTGQRIVAPQFLRDYRPDIVLVMNPIYATEIRGLLGQASVTAEVLTV